VWLGAAVVTASRIVFPRVALLGRAVQAQPDRDSVLDRHGSLKVLFIPPSQNFQPTAPDG